MRLGMFDFKKDDTGHPEPDAPAVGVDELDLAAAAEVSSLDTQGWDELDNEFNMLSLDDLEAALNSGGPDNGDDIGTLLKSLGEEDSDELSSLLNELETQESEESDWVELGDLTGDLNGSPADDSVSILPFEGSRVDDASDAVSGVVTDEIVLALLHEGSLRVADVYASLKNRDESIPLWRTLLAIEGVDHGAVLAQVARQRDYESVSIPEGAPIESLTANMREQLGDDGMDAVLKVGAVPIELSIDPETLAYNLVIAAADPAHPVLEAQFATLQMQTDVRYAPLNEVSAAIRSLGLELDPAESMVVADDNDSSAGDAAPIRTLPSGRHELPDRQGDRDSQDRNQDPERLRRRLSWPKEETDDEAPEEEASTASVDNNPEITSESISEEEAAANLERLDRRARKDRVVAALVRSGATTPEFVTQALDAHAAEGSREAIWRVLAGLDGVDRERVFSEAARVYAFPEVAIGPGQPDHEFVMLIMETIAEERRDELLSLNLLPYEYAIDAETGGARLIFITHDPARSDVHRILAQLKLGRFELRYASEKGIAAVINEVFPRRNEFLDRIDDTQAYDLGTEFEAESSGLIDEGALEAEMSRSGLINLFEATLVEAVRMGVSDVHIFPNPKRQTEIHFRLDGRLRRWHVEEKVHAESFLAVVKDNAMNVDRFERDAAQDGYIQRRVDDALIRFRVSVLPIASANQEIRAESVVIRVLDDRKVLTDLAKLGMLEGAMERMNHAIRQPHGMVILTGPTGSGKSTTLVAALHQVITPEVNVLTIEDPVEYIIEGVRQIKLSHKLDLEQAIRAVLRHDPDIVMVGEMRDKATADLAIKLANTGHLTFSTLHTNDAPAAVSRLYKMGVEPFLIAYAINLVVAQRLIRGLCPNCKVEDTDKDPILMKRLGFTDDEIENLTVYTGAHGGTCATCGGGGYKGRRAVSETLYFSQAIRHIIAESGEEIDEDQIRQQAVKDGMLTLQDSARELVKMGVTSLDEMMRVTASE